MHITNHYRSNQWLLKVAVSSAVIQSISNNHQADDSFVSAILCTELVSTEVPLNVICNFRVMQWL